MAPTPALYVNEVILEEMNEESKSTMMDLSYPRNQSDLRNYD